MSGRFRNSRIKNKRRLAAWALIVLVELWPFVPVVCVLIAAYRSGGAA